MAVTELAVTDFRCFPSRSVALAPEGLTVIRGANGVGKSSLVEALVVLATGRSWRTSTREVLVRSGATRAAVQAAVAIPGRTVTVAATVPVRGTLRVQVNGQTLARHGEVGSVLRTVLFTPDDLHLVSGGPALRRSFLDDTLADRHPRLAAVVHDVDRALRQRGALLQQLGGRLDPAGEASLAVWDERLAVAGEALVAARQRLVADLAPHAEAALGALVGGPVTLTIGYRCSWSGPLADALAQARTVDVRRGVSTVGPHRDELELAIDGRPARTHASQGEQRSVALALRLATYHLAVADGGPAPVLLLDDVFSELDQRRSTALVDQLPATQVLLTTATAAPPSAAPVAVLDMDHPADHSGGAA